MSGERPCADALPRLSHPVRGQRGNLCDNVRAGKKCPAGWSFLWTAPGAGERLRQPRPSRFANVPLWHDPDDPVDATAMAGNLRGQGSCFVRRLVEGHEDRNPAMAAEIGRASRTRWDYDFWIARGMGRHRSLTEVDCAAATPYLAQ